MIFRKKRERFKTSWNYDDIYQYRKIDNKDRYKDFTREQLIDRITQLETIAGTVSRVMSHGDNQTFSVHYGSAYYSDLFPQETEWYDEKDDMKQPVYLWEQKEVDGKKQFIRVEFDYSGNQRIIHQDSVEIHKDTKLGDKCTLIESVAYFRAGTHFGGSIAFGDVRLLDKVINNSTPENVLLKHYDASKWKDINDKR